MAPVTLALTKRLELNPVAFLVSEVLASNIGGTATLVGDPPNIMIASKAELGYLDFVIVLGPIVLVIMAVFLGLFWLVWGRGMAVASHLREAVLGLKIRDAVRDRVQLRRCIWLLAIVNAGFCFHRFIHLQPATVALLGASLFMLVGHGKGQSHKAEDLSYLTDVEWKTIFFFIGLFILVGGLVKVGVIRQAADQLVTMTRDNLTGTTLAVLWGSALLSGIVDNIPYVAAMNPLIVDLARSLHPEITDYAMLVHHPDVMPLWWALALGACLGGNGTIIGASANVVVVDIARRAGYPITFWQFFKLGFPVMVGSVLLSACYLWLLLLR
jgi:Na+/H+ antiporter NhaD/arsenite permease-like protein